MAPSDRVLDMGTGSGCWHGGATARGGGSAGCGFDSVAIDCARDYAQVNGFDQRLTLSVGNARGEQPHDSVRAYTGPREFGSADLAGCRRDPLPLCGRRRAIVAVRSLVEQRAEIEAAYAAYGVYVKAARVRDGWIALEAVGMESCEGGLCS